MKPLVVSENLEGGAGGAAYRLHRGLRRLGVPSQVLVQKKSTKDDAIFECASGAEKFSAGVRARIDKLPAKFYRQARGYFFPQWLPDVIVRRVSELAPDVINLHFVLNGFMRIETLKRLPAPVVWTLHDMWVFTGGCVLTQDCERYRESCGSCPVLGSTHDRDLSRWVWRRKAASWEGVDFTVVTPSSWLASHARASSLLRNRRIEIIPQGIDTEAFKPVDQRVARQILNLPHDKQIVLFGAWRNHPNKGFHFLRSALQRLSESGWGNRIVLVVFGFSRPAGETDIGVESRYLGSFRDTVSLSLVYSAADVLVMPSMQENFSQAALEAFACGIPAVVFDHTGLADIVDHCHNGYLARRLDVEDLAKGIVWVLEDSDRRHRLRQAARQKAEREFNEGLTAQRYLKLFEGVATNRAPSN